MGSIFKSVKCSGFRIKSQKVLQNFFQKPMIKQILRNYQFLSLEQLHVDQGIFFFFPSKKRKRSMLSPFHLKLHKTVSRSFEKSELTLTEALSTSQMLPLKPRGNNVSSSSSVSISHYSLPYSYYNASSIIMPLAIAWILASFL